MSRSRNIKLSGTKTFIQAFEVFQVYNRAKNLSPHTIHTYNISSRAFLDFMGGDFKLSDFSNDKILEYIDYCMKRGNKAVTINHKLRQLRVAFNFFCRARLYVENQD